jgi:hypothetical protein
MAYRIVKNTKRNVVLVSTSTSANIVIVGDVDGSDIAIAGSKSFNAESDVVANGFITITSNKYVVDDVVDYVVDAGNTAITELTAGGRYFVQAANDTGVYLSATSGGSAITLTDGPSETGHTLQPRGNPTFTANIAGASIKRIWTSADSSTTNGWTVVRGANTVWQSDSTSFLDFAGNGVLLDLDSDQDLSLTRTGTSGTCMIELQKIYDTTGSEVDPGTNY